MTYKLETTELIDVTEDPVRPELSLEFRNQPGRTIYSLIDSDENRAATICVAYTKMVPTNVRELEKFTDPNGHIAVAYTVWSKAKGAGRLIVNQLIAHARKQHGLSADAHHVSSIGLLAHAIILSVLSITHCLLICNSSLSTVP